MAGKLGFFAEGCREIGRKVDRLGLRRRLAARDRDRQQALMQLGQTAWQSRIDLGAFAEQRGRLEQLDARAGDLSATVTRLAAERAELQARRQAEVDRFDALLAPAKAAQSQADTAMRAARAALAEKERAIRALEAQAASLPKDETAAAQRQVLTKQAAAEMAAKAPLSDEVSARTAESQRCAAETARLDAERRAALQPIDAELERLRKESAAAMHDRASVGGEQQEAFRGLGATLYESRTADPALAECVQGVAAVDADLATTQAAIDGSLGLTSAMAHGTMAKFGATVLLVPLLLIAGGYGAYGGLEAAGVTGTPTPAKSEPPANMAAIRVAADERRKDEVVAAFMKAPTDPTRRKEGVEILAADVTALGSAVDRSSLPLLVAILDRGEPELRAAAAHAIGMIGPTPAEAPALVKALNDPMPAVRDGALLVLDRYKDPGTQLLVRRVRSGAREGARPESDNFKPTVAPDAAKLGTPIYPSATFLAYASDLSIGRVSFSSPDPVQKVVDFYAAAAAGRPPLGGVEFSRLYFGGSADDPSGGNAMFAQLQARLKQAVVAGMPPAEAGAEYERDVQRMKELPLVRYREAALYGDPAFIALEVAASQGTTRALRYVAVFQDHALGRTGFEVQGAADTPRK
jgi:hypothetical protein